MATTIVTATAVDAARRDASAVTAPGMIPAPDHHNRHPHPAPHAEPHEHGSMDLRVHEKTYANFVTFLVWNVVGIVAILIFLALVNL